VSLDIEGAVGRPSLERSSKSPGPPTAPANEAKDEQMEDAEEGNEDDQAAEEQLKTEVAEKEDKTATKDVEMK
jgi:hypothetical protein